MVDDPSLIQGISTIIGIDYPGNGDAQLVATTVPRFADADAWDEEIRFNVRIKTEWFAYEEVAEVPQMDITPYGGISDDTDIYQKDAPEPEPVLPQCDNVLKEKYLEIFGDDSLLSREELEQIAEKLATRMVSVIEEPVECENVECEFARATILGTTYDTVCLTEFQLVHFGGMKCDQETCCLEQGGLSPMLLTGSWREIGKTFLSLIIPCSKLDVALVSGECVLVPSDDESAVTTPSKPYLPTNSFVDSEEDVILELP